MQQVVLTSNNMQNIRFNFTLQNMINALHVFKEK